MVSLSSLSIDIKIRRIPSIEKSKITYAAPSPSSFETTTRKLNIESKQTPTLINDKWNYYDIKIEIKPIIW